MVDTIFRFFHLQLGLGRARGLGVELLDWGWDFWTKIVSGLGIRVLDWDSGTWVDMLGSWIGIRASRSWIGIQGLGLDLDFWTEIGCLDWDSGS